MDVPFEDLEVKHKENLDNLKAAFDSPISSDRTLQEHRASQLSKVITTLSDQLKELGKLHDSDAISKEDYDRQTKILTDMKDALKESALDAICVASHELDAPVCTTLGKALGFLDEKTTDFVNLCRDKLDTEEKLAVYLTQDGNENLSDVSKQKFTEVWRAFRGKYGDEGIEELGKGKVKGKGKGVDKGKGKGKAGEGIDVDGDRGAYCSELLDRMAMIEASLGDEVIYKGMSFKGLLALSEIKDKKLLMSFLRT